MSRLVIAWAREGGRSVLLADAIGAAALFVPGDRGASALWRYLAASRRTLAEIRTIRPKIIVVQNPPVVAVLVCALGSRLWRSSLIIDSHTGAFIDPKWHRFTWLHRMLTARSAGLIVHNQSQTARAKDWTDAIHETGFVPIPSRPAPVPQPFDGNWLLVPASGAPDEPLEAVRCAALQLAGRTFVITGAEERVRAHFKGPLPPNVHLTGYLPASDYFDLAHSASLILALTTRQETLLSGAFEAVALGITLITSDTAELRGYLGASAVYVRPDSASICAGISRAEQEADSLAAHQAQLQAAELETFNRFLEFLDGLES